MARESHYIGSAVSSDESSKRDLKERIYHMFDENTLAYCQNHCSEESDCAKTIIEESRGHVKSSQAVGRLVGNLLRVIAGASKCRTILEIGSYMGYSAAMMATAMPPGGRLWALEEDESTYAQLCRNIRQNSLENSITPILAEGFAWLADYKGQFDLIFLDARKELYSNKLDLLYNRIVPYGVLAVDNTLAGGKVLAPTHDWEVAMAHFNRSLMKDPRFTVVQLPIRDGFAIALRGGGNDWRIR